ncbi:MAG: PaaI family thioesterase [Variovorax sp.]
MQFARHIPFIHLLGAELLRFEEGESEIALTLRDELNNSWQVAHGGVVMTLLDVAMAHATRVPRKADEGPDPRGVVTIEMKTTFMRPAQGRVRCTGKLLHRSAALAFCEATLVNEAGERLAHATGTFKFLSGLPAGGRRIQSPDASD